MFEEYIQGKTLRRLSRFSCSVVSALVHAASNVCFTHRELQGFMIEGYQAGVLGGVQSTTPFLNAIGVSHCNEMYSRIVLTWL